MIKPGEYKYESAIRAPDIYIHSIPANGLPLTISTDASSTGRYVKVRCDPNASLLLNWPIERPWQQISQNSSVHLFEAATYRIECERGCLQLRSAND